MVDSSGLFSSLETRTCPILCYADLNSNACNFHPPVCQEKPRLKLARFHGVKVHPKTHREQAAPGNFPATYQLQILICSSAANGTRIPNEFIYSSIPKCFIKML